MICPHCGHVNIPGSDTCEQCRASLTGISAPQADRPPLQERIEADRIGFLEPAAPVTVPPGMKVCDVIRLMAERKIGCVLITFSDTLIGIFTERDCLMRIGDRLDQVGQEPIRHFMTPAPETLSSRDSIAFALNRMAVGGFRHIPIEQDERTTGIISVRDVVGYIAEQFPEILAEAK